MLKKTCIRSLTQVNTPCNLWQGKIPLARLSKPQRAWQKLWNIQLWSLFFRLQAIMQNMENSKVIKIFLGNMRPENFYGHHAQLLIRA